MERYQPKGFPVVNGIRDHGIYEAHLKGQSNADLALEYNLTRERIWYIIKRFKLDSIPGGREHRIANESTKRKTRRALIQNKKALKTYGVSKIVVDNFRATDIDYKKSALGRYIKLRYHCKKREIELALSIVEWWDIWQASGHYENYGKYSLGRRDYNKGYTKQNSIIRTSKENAAYYQNVRNGKIKPEVCITVSCEELRAKFLYS